MSGRRGNRGVAYMLHPGGLRVTVREYVRQAIAVTAVTMAVGGCGSKEPVRKFPVNEHMFEVPIRHLLPSRVVWFPQLGQSKGFNFVLDPDGGQGDNIQVTVEPRNVTCRLDKIRMSSMLRKACSEEGLVLPDYGRGDRVEKVHIVGDETQWTYQVTRGPSGAEKYPIAGCYMLDSKKSLGSCQSFGSFDGIVYSVSFDDAEIGRLGEIRERVQTLLSSWRQQ